MATATTVAPKNGAANKAAATKAVAKKDATKKPAAKKPPVPKPDPLAVSHIEYMILTPALDPRAKTAVREDRHGVRASKNRTDRFQAARIYRTGADSVTIQTTGDEQFGFRISVLEQILAKCKDLSTTKEIPNFS